MTRKYTRKIVERPVLEEVGAFCDWCTISDDDAYAEIGYPLTPIVLSINEGEEFGERWTKDICGRCADLIFPLLKQARFNGGLLQHDNDAEDNPLWVWPDKDEEDD